MNDVRLLALEEAVRFAKQVAAMDNIRGIPECVKIAQKYQAIFETTLRAAPIPQCDAEPVAWRYRWSAPDDALWEIVPDQNMLPTNRDGWEIEPLYVAAPSRLDAGSAEAIADEICKDPRIFTRDWNHSLEGLRLVIVEKLIPTPPALPAGEEVRRATIDIQRFAETIETTPAYSANQLGCRLEPHNPASWSGSKEPMVFLVEENRRALIVEALRALSPSSNGKPATENEG